jgi:hypothetical protein
MNATQPDLIMQRWNVVQHELLPMLIDEMGAPRQSLTQTS